MVCADGHVIPWLLITAGIVGLFYGAVVGLCLGALADRFISPGR
jgi:hypothetical protein